MPPPSHHAATAVTDRHATTRRPKHGAVLSRDKSWVLAMLAAKRRLRVAPVPPQAADLTRPARVAPGNARSGRRNSRCNRTKEQIRPSIQPCCHDHPSHTVVRPMGVRLNYASHTEIRILPLPCIDSKNSPRRNPPPGAAGMICATCCGEDSIYQLSRIER